MNFNSIKLLPQINNTFDKLEKYRVQNLNTLGKIKIKKFDIFKKINFEKGKFPFNKSVNKQFLTTAIKKNRKKEQRDFTKELSIKYKDYPCPINLMKENTSLKPIDKFILELDKMYNNKYLKIKTKIENNNTIIEKKNKNEKKRIPLTLIFFDDYFSIKNVDNVLDKILFFIYFTLSKFKIEYLIEYKNKILINNKNIWDYYYKNIPQNQFKEKENIFKLSPNIKKQNIINNKLDFFGMNNFKFIYDKNIISYIKNENNFKFEINIGKFKFSPSDLYLNQIKQNKTKSFYHFIKLPPIFLSNENSFKIISNLLENKRELKDLNLIFSNETTTKIVSLSNTKNIINKINTTPLTLANISKILNLDNPFVIKRNDSINYKSIPEISFSKLKLKRPYKVIDEIKDKINNDNYHQILINSNTMSDYINEKKNYFISLSVFKENLDIIFDINICGIILFSSELNDEYDFSVYNEIFEIINDCYLQFSTFYFIIIDDEINKRNDKYNISLIIKKLKGILNEKFKIILKKREFNLSFHLIPLNTTSQIYETLINILHEIKSKKEFNKYSIFNLSNLSLINKILYENSSHYKNIDYLKSIYTNDSYIYLNTLESILINNIKDLNLKKELILIINEKYENKNINIELI